MSYSFKNLKIIKLEGRLHSFNHSPDNISHNIIFNCFSLLKICLTEIMNLLYSFLLISSLLIYVSNFCIMLNMELAKKKLFIFYIQFKLLEFYFIYLITIFNISLFLPASNVCICLHHY